MNKIEAILVKHNFENYYDFLNIRIDDYWLDEKLEELYPNEIYKGILPTLCGLNEEKETEIVLNRILPKLNENTVCPIFMCPDDCDFSCTLVVAEIYNKGSVIEWKRIGIDVTQDLDINQIGSDVEWFNKFSSLSFEKNQYIEMLKDFREKY